MKSSAFGCDVSDEFRLVRLDQPVEIPFVESKHQSEFEIWPNYRVYSNGTVVDSETNIPCPVLCDAKGYLWTLLIRMDGSARKLDCVPLSRLMAISFQGAPQSGQRACFVDGNRCRTCAENVKWMSHKESLECPRFYSRPKIAPRLDPASFLLEICQRYDLPFVEENFTLCRGWLANCIVKFQKFSDPQEISRICSQQQCTLIPEAMIIIEQANPSWTSMQIAELRPGDTLTLLDLTHPKISTGKNKKRTILQQEIVNEGKKHKHTNE